jgi:thiamine biosynthesis lipoprotein
MRASSAETRRAQPLLGTLVEIRACSAPSAVDDAFAAIRRVHELMSAQDAGSDIARLRSGRCDVHPWTRQVLARAEEIRAGTGGLFDPSACGFALDGIAKGFAVDLAVEILEAQGASGSVNAGGDLRVFGDGFEDVHVRLDDDFLHIGRVRDAAVATSASALLVDPRGPARRAARGATVVAADCMTADALTKPCLLEPERATEFAARFGAIALVHA